MSQRRIGDTLTKNIRLTQVGGEKLSPSGIARTAAELERQLRNFGLRRLHEEGLLNTEGILEFERLEAGGSP